VNRLLVRSTIYGAVYPENKPQTTATLRLAHILDGPSIKNILNGEPRDKENDWTLSKLMETLTTLPGILMYAKLAYKFEGMTDVLNGTFVEEMTDLLGSPTSGKGLAIYEVDTNFEMMAEMIVKSYPDSVTLMSYMRTSLRQAYSKRLSKTSKDKSV
jgi:hypothetical protein